MVQARTFITSIRIYEVPATQILSNFEVLLVMIVHEKKAPCRRAFNSLAEIGVAFYAGVCKQEPNVARVAT